MSARAVQLFCYLGSLLLFGCGGGGGGYGGGGGGGGGSPTVTGKGFAPSTGPGDTAGYFPVASGDQWQVNYFTTHPQAVAPTAGGTGSGKGTEAGPWAPTPGFTPTKTNISAGGDRPELQGLPSGAA